MRVRLGRQLDCNFPLPAFRRALAPAVLGASQRDCPCALLLQPVLPSLPTRPQRQKSTRAEPADEGGKGAPAPIKPKRGFELCCAAAAATRLLERFRWLCTFAMLALCLSSGSSEILPGGRSFGSPRRRLHTAAKQRTSSTKARLCAG